MLRVIGADISDDMEGRKYYCCDAEDTGYDGIGEGTLFEYGRHGIIHKNISFLKSEFKNLKSLPADTCIILRKLKSVNNYLKQHFKFGGTHKKEEMFLGKMPKRKSQ